MKSSFLTLFAMLFLAATFFSCETDEPAPRARREIVNPIEAFMYPRDLKVYEDEYDSRRWLILVTTSDDATFYIEKAGQNKG